MGGEVDQRRHPKRVGGSIANPSLNRVIVKVPRRKLSGSGSGWGAALKVQTSVGLF